jgi:squalene-hopene/tetraprenyl-beta-curcumene cyclase
LTAIQPASGGFLEATPLTSFVTMSLASSGLDRHPVAQKGVRFLKESMRTDGSWPIDTNLATWVTTLSINALGAEAFSEEEKDHLRDWLLNQQYKVVHPYTQAAPGGWAWTNLSGGVPDADDTAGALLALAELGGDVRPAATAGVKWLLDLQNRDGGMPTFCRGWGKLPFDQSSPDLTAHALRAWETWGAADLRVERAMKRAIRYLVRSQREDGSWVPLWFGNPWSKDQTNPIYGTARVLQCGDLLPANVRERALDWLRTAQCTTTEEAALAAGVLGDPKILADRSALEPSPIGLYFASLWYSEKLYPLIFTVEAMSRMGEA